MAKKTLDNIQVAGKRVLVRVDFNVPMKEGKITNDKRIVAALPTIKKLIADGGKVILCSHLGKPKNGPEEKFSLAPVAVRLSEYLGKEVVFANDDTVVGENAKVKYIEKHYGEGEGTGERILNPTTEIYMEENSFCEMESVQIKGVDSTKRDTVAKLEAGARLVILEKLMTHGKQVAHSDMVIELNGENASSQIISRSVAKDNSEQVFYPRAVGNDSCRAHVQCDSIIMDNAKIRSIPEIAANHWDAN